jgi:small subunit ribosomal protein S4e
MAKMGSRKHLKRYKAPKSWPIHPKEDTWTVKPSPGSHSINDSIPLTLVIRDVLKLADNSREAKRIINTGNVLIDGRAVKDYKFPVGFMDVLTIPKTEENYRILLDTKGRLTLHPITAEDASYKLAKIVNKSTIKGGKTQLNLHDGRNVLVDEDVYAGQDVVCIAVPEQEIKENFKFDEGVVVLVTGGKHTGELGKIKEVIVDESSKPNTVVIEKANDDTFLTLKEYAFVIGQDEPAIDLLEVNQ